MRNREFLPIVRNPFLTMRRLTEEMDRMLEDFNFRHPLAVLTEGRTYDWAPAIEVMVEKDKKLIVKAELPGLTKEDVKIDITAEYLTLQGERKQEKEEKFEGLIRNERFYGTFFRQIPLPEGAKFENATAIFKHGVLEIEVPLEVKKPVTARQLQIQEEPKKETKKELVGV